MSFEVKRGRGTRDHRTKRGRQINRAEVADADHEADQRQLPRHWSGRRSDRGSVGFHPDLTGRENIYLQGAIMGMPRAQIARRFDEILAFSGVEPLIDTPLKRYSSGMQARLGFAIAAHMDPDVLFVDEVLSVGDVSFQARCLERMREHLQRGTTLVFVSHNLAAVAALCRRCLVLGGGRMLHDGPTEAGFSAYLEAGQQFSWRDGVTDEFFRLRSAKFRPVHGAPDRPLRPHEPVPSSWRSTACVTRRQSSWASSCNEHGISCMRTELRPTSWDSVRCRVGQGTSFASTQDSSHTLPGATIGSMFTSGTRRLHVS